MLFERDRLTCYGCTHSAVNIPWPSAPSGERPCGFCIRNPFTEHALQQSTQPVTWYDGAEPVSVPMDAYYSLDMRDQILEWIKDARAPTPEEKQEAVDRLLAMREVASS